MEGDFSGSFSRTAGVRGDSGAGAEKTGEALFPAGVVILLITII